MAGLHLSKSLLLSTYHSPPWKLNCSTSVAGFHLFKNLNPQNKKENLVVIWVVIFYFYSIGLSQLPHLPSLGSESWAVIIHLYGADEEGVRCLYIMNFKTRTESVHKLRKFEKQVVAWIFILLDNLSITSISTTKQHLKLLNTKMTELCHFSVYPQVPRPLGATPLLKFFANFCEGSMWTIMQNLEVIAWKMTELCPF